MKLNLLSNDSELQRALEETGHFEVLIKTDVEDIDTGEIIIISDREIDYNELTVYLENKQKSILNKTIFYLLSNEYSEQMIKNINFIGQTKNIIIIPPKLTISQIVARVSEKVFPYINQKNKNIITFFGADNKVGTTMVAQSTAEMLSKNTNAKIGLLFLSGNPSTSYIKSKGKAGLDDIKIKLMNNILSADEVFSVCTKENENLYLLPGADYILDIRHYHPEYIDRLIQLASEKFNLIIIDTGSNIDSGMAIAALNSTKNKYLVATQQETARVNFERIESQVLKRLQIEPGDFMLVVNKYIKSNQIYTAKQVADLYNMTLATYIPNLELLGWQAEFDQRTLLHYNNQSYNYQIEQLSKIITAQTHIKYQENHNRKEGFLKKAFSSMGGVF